ncbi:MAG: nucleotidyltransferase domain-containing protein [Spirochaetales bacterium]|nr:nucleotidyltransferase domain-containing protein [Spirochaetales bacterium]
MLTKQELREILETIVKNYQPDKVILFGSYAREEQVENSDLDLFIISDVEKDLPRYRRGLKVRILLSDFNVSKDVLFYTHEEVNKWKDVPNTFVNRVFSEGKIIYG